MIFQLIREVRVKLYVKKLVEERNQVMKKYESMADLWAFCNHKVLREYENRIDHMQFKIESLTY